jgi:hypothetical protein
MQRSVEGGTYAQARGRGVGAFDVEEGKRLDLAIEEGGTGSRFGMYEIKVVVCTGPPVF